MVRLCVGVFSSLLMLVAHYSQAIENPNQNYAEKVAIFEYLRGHKDKAMLELAKNSGVALGDANQVSRELFRTEQLQETLAKNLVGSLPAFISDKLWLDISELRRRQGDCEGALLALLNLKELSTEMDHRQRFQRVSCMLQQEVDAKVLVAAERVAIEGQPEGRVHPSIWLAYIYNNLATAAQRIKQPLLAQAYFKRALQHTDTTEEGRSLNSYLTLNLAYSYFGENRFDFARDSFAELRENTEWIDQGLLGYGWSAYKNNQPGLALEAWRQLVRLPFKSINVYEGYLAIPFAFEQQNALSEALAGYEQAISRYLGVTAQIDKLSATFLIEDIHAHAIAFNQEGESHVEPIHPLLVYAFAKPDFQDVLMTIGRAGKFLDKLTTFENELMRFSQIRHVASAESSVKSKRIVQSEQAIESQFTSVIQKIDAVAESLLKEAMVTVGSQHPVNLAYQRYTQLRAGIALEAPYFVDIQQVRGLLMGQLQENDRLFTSDNHRIILLMQQFKIVNQQYQAYLSVKQQIPSSGNIDQKIYLLQEKLTKAKSLVKGLQANAEELLLGMTMEALAEQKRQIQLFEGQARISAARISEEFYQQGGQRLWR